MSRITTESAEAVAAAAPVHPRRRWWLLGAIGLTQLMAVLDATIVNIALPSAQLEFFEAVGLGKSSGRVKPQSPGTSFLRVPVPPGQGGWIVE